MGIQSFRVRKLIREVESNRLEVKSFFQRRQVWTDRDKEFFIDTVLKKYPFPEIFIAESIDGTNSLECRTWLVDGKQRVTTLIDYFRGKLRLKEVQPFEDLPGDLQKDFLEYEVAIRDLGPASEEQIRAIFGRINATDYALKTMEKLNAMFSGKYIQYAEYLSRHRFFIDHDVFPEAYQKRMYDVTFCVILVTTLLSDYYRRDERNREFLERYNDEFLQQERIHSELEDVFEFVERCNFEKKSRAWRQTDLLTLLVELHKAIAVDKIALDPSLVAPAIKHFYGLVDEMYKAKGMPDEEDVPSGQESVFRYLKASAKASNDKYSRIDRAEIISNLIRSTISEPTKSTGSNVDNIPIVAQSAASISPGTGKSKLSFPATKSRTKKKKSADKKS